MEISPLLKPLELQFSHSKPMLRVCCPFRKVRTDGSQTEGSLYLHSNRIRLRYSLACFFTGVNADLTLFYAGSQ